MFQNTSKRAARRAYPISAYTGSNGGGKTACMIWDTLPSLEAGRPVLSTVRILDYLNPRECEGCEEPGHVQPVWGPAPRDSQGNLTYEPAPIIGYKVHQAAHPLYVPLTDWEQLMDAERCDVLLDEVTGVASSRQSASLPAPVANKLVQLRRADVLLRWSAPAWARSDLIIRECTQIVTWAQGYLSTQVTEGERMWRHRRLFKWRTFDANMFEDFTAGKREALGSIQADWHWGPKSPAFSAYDTFDSVTTVGTVTDAGTCYSCGGSRAKPKCSCDTHQITRLPKPKAVPGTDAPAARQREDVAGTGTDLGPGPEQLRGDTSTG